MQKWNYYFFLTFLLIVFANTLNAQTVKINSKNKPLKDVFIELRDLYNIQFAYNNKYIEDCYITKNKTYNSPEEAIKDLTKICNLTYKKSGEVFIILPILDKEITPEKLHVFAGKITDKTSGETLPFAIIKYKDKYISTDVSGNFSFKIKDSLVNVNISYLGFYKKDTLIHSNKNLNFKLNPAVIEMNEILVKYQKIIFDMHVGQTAGNIKLNHKITSFLPGNQDNGIYNMLRLQAGIMAAGEQSDDYTIWGSYQGQNLVQFDNITLFNISSFDDNQSAVHPLMIKDIEIKKGGFNAEYSNRVGGIVNIIGKNGNNNKLTGNVNINNQAVSSYLNIPINKRFSLQTSYRQTFNNLFNWNANFQNVKSKREYYTPSFDFRDFNAKLSGKINNKDNFYLSLLVSDDNFEYKYKNSGKKSYSETNDQKRMQYGASFFYNKHFKSGSFSDIVFSYSGLNTIVDNYMNYEDIETEKNVQLNSYIANKINNFSSKITHNLPAKGFNKFQFGAEYISNSTYFEKSINNTNENTNNKYSNRLSFFVKDDISILKNLNIQAGLRADFPVEIGTFYFQPRINATYNFSEKFKLNIAYGVYNQFLSKNIFIDKFENYLYVWILSDNKNIPVLSAKHYTTGITFNKSVFKFSIEAFYKEIENITLYLHDRKRENLNKNIGKSNITGLDFYLKTKLKKHELWFAYTLSETLEHFPFFQSHNYQFTPHDQTHELKGAAIFNFSPFYISTNYVYGSGLQFTKRKSNTLNPIPYNRLDLAVLYKLKYPKVNIDIGISVLNVLNTDNIKYNNSINLPDSKVVYSQSTPFTPMLNFHVGF